MWEPVALCCFSRRTGCLVLGAIELIAAISWLLIGTCIITVGEVGVYRSMCRDTDLATMKDCEDVLRTAVSTTTGIMMVFAMVQLVCASMMIHGVRKGDHCLMCPFLIKNVIVVAVHVILASVGVLVMLVSASPLGILAALPGGIFVAYCYGALIFMWTYFLLTVRAYYYELKRGKHEDQHMLIEQ